MGSLEFELPDTKRFLFILGLCSTESRWYFPHSLNAANEVAVEAFLQGHIGFMDIPRLVSNALERHRGVTNPNIQDILAVDASVRKQMVNLM